MGLTGFLIVIGFTVFWFIKYGKDLVFEMHNFKKVGWVALGLWIFTLWGVGCLIHMIYNGC